MIIATQGCRKWGGGNISDYVLLLVPYTSRGVWGHAPQNYCALRQLLIQSDAKICLTVVS